MSEAEISVGSSPPDLAGQASRIAARTKPPRLTPAALDGATPDPARPWVPERLVPLRDSAVFASLSAAQRLRYNHYYALLAAEQFIWLEQSLVIRPIGALLRGQVAPAALRPVLESFVADEISHSAALWALLQRAAPEFYPEPRRVLFQPPAKVRALVHVCTAFPRTLPAWAMFISVLEEHTILISRLYQKSEDCDPLFARAHQLHAQDEARHCHIDTLLCDWLFAPLGGAQRALSTRLLVALFKAYYDTGWGHDRPIDFLIRDFPELAARRSELIAGVTGGRDASFCRHLFSEDNSPLTAKLARRYPALAAAIASVT